MDTLRIYQLYFKPEQVQYLNPLFTPYDNTVNEAPTLREYPLLKKCWALSRAAGITHWGAVSWNYKFKFNATVAGDDGFFYKYITENPGWDVYTFDPFPNHSALIWNVWEQGQWCHPHLLTIVDGLAKIAGLDHDFTRKPQPSSSICWGSMAVGDDNFWSDYFTFADHFFSGVSRLPAHLAYLYKSSTGYIDASIDHFSFIQERLMSAYLADSGLRVLPYHATNGGFEDWVIELQSLKNNGRWRDWWNLRQKWVDKIYPGHRIDWAAKWMQ